MSESSPAGRRGRPRVPGPTQFDAACSALAHKDRRTIVDLLARGPLTAGQIASAFPEATRQAVGAHLRRLRAARLVEVARRSHGGDGREQVYRLSPQPLELVRDWVERYKHFWEAKLEELAALAETTASPGANPMHSPESSLLAAIEPVTLAAGGVRLVPLAEAHRQDVRAALQHGALWAYSTVPMETEADADAYFDTAMAEAANGQSLPFAILLQGEGREERFAGSTRIANIAPEHARVEIGWTWLLPDQQRTGVNRTAKLLLLTHCFETLGCRRVEFKGHSANMRSRNALAGIGATFEGVLRAHMVMPDGSQRDTFFYSVIAQEWPHVKQQLAATIR